VLRSWGVDCVHAGEVGLSAAGDAEILHRGRAEDRVVVTLDADFRRLMTLSGASRPSVVRLRIQGLKGQDLAHLLKGLFEQSQAALEAGALVSVGTRQVRIRRLPLRADRR